MQNMHVGEIIQRLRDRSGLKKSQVAKKAGITVKPIDELERRSDFYMRRENLDSVLQVFGIDFEQLVKMAAINWQSDLSGEMRLKILDLIQSLDENQLLRAHHLLTDIAEKPINSDEKEPSDTAKKAIKQNSPQHHGRE